MDDIERIDLVKDYKVKDYKEYLYEYSDLDVFMKECFLMHNIAMKIDDERRKERLDGLNWIAIERASELSNTDLNKFIDSLKDEKSVLEDMERDWAFKAKSLKKIEQFIEDNEILDDKYIEELKNCTTYYPFDMKIESSILNHIDTNYPSLYEGDLSKFRFYKNNKRLRRNLAVLSILCDENYALCDKDIEDYKSEKSDISNDFNKLVTNNIKEVSYVVARRGFRLPKELITFFLK